MPKGPNTPKQNPIARYFQETIGELRKVSWPTREETLRLAAVVLAVLVVSAIFLGTIDYLLSQLFLLLLA